MFRLEIGHLQDYFVLPTREEDDMKKVILLLRFSQSSPLLYMISVNTY